MGRACAEAACGKRPFDLLIENVRIVNVFNDTVTAGCIGIAGEYIAYVGRPEPDFRSLKKLDGQGRFALPGFIDSHMHLESSMLTPDHFAAAVLPLGTTTVAADPHEIANVLGRTGVAALAEACRDLPLRVLLMAPSTIPSAPGFEGCGYDVDGAEMEHLLEIPGVYGLGEVMDFNAVAEAEPRILSVVEAAARRGCLMDGHASLLTGRRLQTFRAAGLDSDHTTSSADKLREELALGFTVQIQPCMLSREMAQAMNEAPVQDRICLVTDDVPLPRLMERGHLNGVVAQAVELGLDPVRAIRFATINPASRLRLYDTGALAPGLLADIQLVDDLRAPKPSVVFRAGKTIAENGVLTAPLNAYTFPETTRHSVHCRPVLPEDFQLRCPVKPDFSGGTARVNLIWQDGVSARTQLREGTVPLIPAGDGTALAQTDAYCTMAVFNRYGKNRRGLALISGMPPLCGAAALTYGHDAHNLAVYGTGEQDLTAAANAVVEMEGGLCAARNGELVRVPLPVAGLLSEEPAEKLLEQLQAFLDACGRIGFRHRELMSFFTLMPLAVSPVVKCTDLGLVQTAEKRFLPLVLQITEENG